MRRDLITRTISGTKVVAKVVNPATDEITKKEIVLGKYIEDSKKLEKEVKKQLDESTEVLIHIVSSEKMDKLYGITVSDFMAHAIELDPETRNAIETEDETEEN